MSSCAQQLANLAVSRSLATHPRARRWTYRGLSLRFDPQRVQPSCESEGDTPTLSLLYSSGLKLELASRAALAAGQRERRRVGCAQTNGWYDDTAAHLLRANVET